MTIISINKEIIVFLFDRIYDNCQKKEFCKALFTLKKSRTYGEIIYLKMRIH